MSSSRRDFVVQSMAAAGTVLAGGLGCGSCAERGDDAERVADAWEPAYLELERSGALAEREERLWSMYRECTCCPRGCGVDRVAGETGVCSSTARLRLPLVYNTGGYDSLEVVRLLDGVVDIYLPDFKYQDGELAAKYSAEASDYPEVAASTIGEMYRQVGDLEVDGHGIARRGLIVRHLVLPHNIAGTDRFVRWVAEELSPATAVNLMAQYRPEHRAHEYPRIARRLTSEEWRQALDWAQEAGLRSAVRL